MSHVPPSASPEPTDESPRLVPPRYGERIADAEHTEATRGPDTDGFYRPRPGERPAITGDGPAMTGERPTMAGERPTMAGERPAMAGDEPASTAQPSDLPAMVAPSGATAISPLVAPPTEGVLRGLVLALLVIPVGATAWVLLWNFGFVASIVSFGIAWGAVRLYRIGSGGAVSRGAFWGIVGIIVVALAVSMLAAIASDLISATGLGMTAALTSDDFWSLYWHNVFGNGRMWAAYLPSILMMIVFGALGCFNTIRRLARESRRVSG